MGCLHDEATLSKVPGGLAPLKQSSLYASPCYRGAGGGGGGGRNLLGFPLKNSGYRNSSKHERGTVE